jgi:hypothetical protein
LKTKHNRGFKGVNDLAIVKKGLPLKRWIKIIIFNRWGDFYEPEKPD